VSKASDNTDARRAAFILEHGKLKWALDGNQYRLTNDSGETLGVVHRGRRGGGYLLQYLWQGRDREFHEAATVAGAKAACERAAIDAAMQPARRNRTR
jgi:hypothetical protein